MEEQPLGKGPSLAGDPLGLHRVTQDPLPGEAPAPPGSPLPLPQRAWRLDADPDRVFETEILVEVETLNVDAASFRQMEEEVGGLPEAVGAKVLETVERRGKQHNPVTGSGGMLLGRVARVGKLAEGRGVVVGDEVATLASLSLTPLRLQQVRAIRPPSAQVDVVGTAVIFQSAPFAKLPRDLDRRVALAALDVAGAAPQVARLVGEGQSVVVLGGGGKSGALCAIEARLRVGKAGRVIALENHAPFAKELEALSTQSGLRVCDAVISGDARDVVAVRDRVRDLTSGQGADLVLSCVNVSGCEMAAIAAAKDRGRVYFFAMSTSFTAAALGAEGIGADVDLYIGNGYAHGHAEHTLDLVRREPELRALFERRYA
jgi:L-erythro-3,5-diaminohexanoate dehydrogenase